MGDLLSTRVTEARALQRQVANLARELESATEPLEIIKIDALLDGIETTMRESGLYTTTEIRPVNETRMWARWKLGRALDLLGRGHGPGRGKKVSVDQTSFRKVLKELQLDKSVALDAHRIGTLPEPKLKKTLAEARDTDDLVTFSELIKLARPYWFQASRKIKHRNIAKDAEAKMILTRPGPFPLIYADPPWKFEIYSEMGADRTPDQHYPTLTDKEIMNYKIDGVPVCDLAHKDAALLMWCTSSNIRRAFDIMDAWDFTYKSQAVWVKTKADGMPIGGMGLVFRNMHEVLLYGTRGKMPGPQYQPPSVFLYPRGRHSAKPSEVRTEIEKMYPDFDEHSRLELFARETVAGWTCYGFEADRDAAE